MTSSEVKLPSWMQENSFLADSVDAALKHLQKLKREQHAQLSDAKHLTVECCAS